jgi:hypothetical protein
MNLNLETELQRRTWVLEADQTVPVAKEGKPVT